MQLPGWTYPLVCDLASGELKYDNFSGRWGDQARLDAFLQAYAVERARPKPARRASSARSRPSRTARSS